MNKERRNSAHSTSSIYTYDYAVIGTEWKGPNRLFENRPNRYGLIGLIVDKQHKNIKQVEATAFLRYFVWMCQISPHHADTFRANKWRNGCINTMSIVNSQAGVHSRTFSTVVDKYTKTTRTHKGRLCGINIRRTADRTIYSISNFYCVRGVSWSSQHSACRCLGICTPESRFSRAFLIPCCHFISFVSLCGWAGVCVC